MSFTESGHWQQMLGSIIYLKALCSCCLPPFISFTPSLSWLLCLCLPMSPSLCVYPTAHHIPFYPPFWMSLSIFLSHPSDLHVEGLFRVPGHSLRQAALREMLNAGAEIDLETGDFHPNDAATLLKAYLGELPEPLLTHRHYHAHLKIGGIGWLLHRFLSYSQNWNKEIALTPTCSFDSPVCCVQSWLALMKRGTRQMYQTKNARLRHISYFSCCSHHPTEVC